MSESSFGGDVGGGFDSGGFDTGGGDLGGGMTSPSFGPDPSVPSFASDPLGTPAFDAPSIGAPGADQFAYTPPAAPTPSIWSSTDPGFLGLAGPQIGGPIPTIGGIGPGAGTTGVASPTTLDNLQAAMPGAPFETPSVFGPPPTTPMLFTPPPTDPAATDPASTDPASADPGPTYLGSLGLTPPTFSADPSVPTMITMTTTTAADGFAITPAAATAVVDTATGLTSDTGNAGSGLASLALTPTAFGAFGSPVATEQTALQTSWGQAFTSLTQGLTTLFGHVGTAITGYLTADADVAQGFGGATTATTATAGAPTTTPPAPTTPPQDKPLPPGGWDSMKPSDFYTPFLLDGAAANFVRLGYWNAAKLVDHYLDGTGTDYTVDPAQMLRDIPTFQGLVDTAVAAHAGQPTWQTTWENTSTDISAGGKFQSTQSGDWYWALHDFRYRVFGTTDPATGQGSYTVEVYKPYVFGAPRSDIPVPGTGGMWTVPQDDLQHLHDTGRAADFLVRGSATFPR